MNEKQKQAFEKSLLTTDKKIHNHREVIKGYDFNQPFDFDNYMAGLKNMGIQSSHMHKAIDIISEMLLWRGENNERVNTFLSFTTSASSSGLRELIAYLCEHKLVDNIVTSAGAVEEDMMKTFSPHLSAEFDMDDVNIHKTGWNRVGNMICADETYSQLQDFLFPLMDEMKDKQKEGVVWSPSTTLKFWGDNLTNDQSFVRQAAKNNIPIYVPAFTDGAIGDFLYFNSFTRKDQLVIDYVSDFKRIVESSINAKKNGAVCLGSSVPKHHVLNVNCFGTGLDYAVYITTAQEYDASDSGASIGEAKTWGKIGYNAKAIKLVSEATLAFPLIMAQTFVKYKLNKLVR